MVGKTTREDLRTILLVTWPCRQRGMGERDGVERGISQVGDRLNTKYVHQCLGSNTAVESCGKRCENDVKKKGAKSCPLEAACPLFVLNVFEASMLSPLLINFTSTF